MNQYFSIEESQGAFNVPFNLVVEGSYFGDNDCLFQKKCTRESTAQADQDCHLLLLKRSNLDELLDNFIEIKNQMMSVAIEKRKYHRRLIFELIKRQKANEFAEIFNEDGVGSNFEMRNYRSLVIIICEFLTLNLYRNAERIQHSKV